MALRDEFAHMSEYEMAVKHAEVCAECARLEGEELHAHGFSPIQVAGLDRLIWRSPTGQLYTTEYALAQIWAIREHEKGGGE